MLQVLNGLEYLGYKVSQETVIKRQVAGGRRQEAGGRRQGAGGRR